MHPRGFFLVFLLLGIVLGQNTKTIKIEFGQKQNAALASGNKVVLKNTESKKVVVTWPPFSQVEIAPRQSKEFEMNVPGTFHYTAESVNDRSDYSAGTITVSGTPVGQTRPYSTGYPCTNPSDCQSGYCVNEVCCESECPGACEACIRQFTGTVDGTCANVAIGKDPKDACTFSPIEGCQLNGLCNGKGECGYYPGGTICKAGSCSDDGASALLEGRCDGLGGACNSVEQSCSPYLCAFGECLSSCTGNDDCAAGFACIGDKCAVLKSVGAQCRASSDCASGYCVDDVCCEDACDDTCKSCRGAHNGGRDGECGYTLERKNPRKECEYQGPKTCGTSGFCDGAGACATYPDGTDCGTPVCEGDKTALTSMKECAAGECVDAADLSCGGYFCSESTDACMTGCGADTDCQTGFFCGTSYKCESIVTVANGLACERNAGCTSGFCVDGICCDSACTQDCKSCKLTGTVGTCSNVPLNGCHEGCGLCSAKVCNGNGVCINYVC